MLPLYTLHIPMPLHPLLALPTKMPLLSPLLLLPLLTAVFARADDVASLPPGFALATCQQAQHYIVSIKSQA